MATIYLTLSAKATDATQKEREIRIRFKHGKIDQQAKTNIFILPEYWDVETQQIIIPNFRLLTAEKKEIKTYLTNQKGRLEVLIATIQKNFNETDKNSVPANWLKLLIDKCNFPDKYIPETEKTPTLFEFIDTFLKEYPNRTHGVTGLHFAPKTIQQYNALKKHLNEFAKTEMILSFLKSTSHFMTGLWIFLKINCLQQTV
jgi:hypothetical protein